MYKLNRSLLFLFMVLALMLVSCGGETETADTPEATPETVAEVATDTPQPTATDEPTATPEPTNTATPEPTNTPAPTDTPAPTNTPSAPEPTPTKPRPTPASQTGSSEEGDVAGLELMVKSEDSMRELETVSFDQEVVLEAEGFSQVIAQNCMADNLEETAYCVTELTINFAGGEPITLTTETVMREGTTWVRTEGAEWEEQPADALESAGLSPDGLTDLRISDYVIETLSVTETDLNGVPVYEIEFVLDVNAYFGSILGEEMANSIIQEGANNEGGGIIWIGVEDLLTYKLNVLMTLEADGQTLTMTTRAVYEGFNEPVEIPDPTAE